MPSPKPIAPLADTSPRPAVAVSRSSTSRDPPNRPVPRTLVRTVPVVALSIRAPFSATWPRMVGLLSRPPMSAPTATGPLRSKNSTPLNRQSVSAGPA